LNPTVVTVPDAEELDITFDPLKQFAKTDVGVVRPVVVTVLMNREQARRAAKWARQRAKQHPKEPPPVLMRKPLSPAETAERMSMMLIKEYEDYHRYFPLKTLSDYMDDRAARTLEEAMKRGQPLDRTLVRQAIGNMMHEMEMEQAK
jgi:hypothetical protein